jgi:hypothetical protein
MGIHWVIIGCNGIHGAQKGALSAKCALEIPLSIHLDIKIMIYRYRDIVDRLIYLFTTDPSEPTHKPTPWGTTRPSVVAAVTIKMPTIKTKKNGIRK